MKKDYICPHCNGHLNVRENIIFKARVKNTETKGLLLLSPELGDYKTIKHDSLQWRDGDFVELCCPICHANLAADDVGNHLAKINLVEDGETYDLFFSEIVGEHCTYKIKDKEVEAFGEDSEKYTNYFGEKPNY